MSWVLVALGAWALGWWVNSRLAASPLARTQGGKLAVPVIFGLTILILWEGLVRGLNVSPVILPPPSAVAVRFAESLPILWGDFVQTAVKGALSGYLIGCAAAFATAIVIDRSPFLQRGLLPVGNFVAALPIVGIAPIMVMWFGFDWQSKAAVVVVMVFFPMLVNTIAGLKASDAMQRDLLATYSASYTQTLLKLRLPSSMPYLVTSLKVGMAASLVGAIVGELPTGAVAGLGARLLSGSYYGQTVQIWAALFAAAVVAAGMVMLIGMVERGTLKRMGMAR